MFTYQQSTGLLLDAKSHVIGRGYAGHGDGLNQPEMQEVHQVGPLPRGFYTIGAPHDDAKTGRVTMDLEPDAGNEMFERSLFRLHGDNAARNCSASEGCIVMPLDVRLAIAIAIGWRVNGHDFSVTAIPATADNRLQVVA
jgi:hypothetical protein